MDTISISLATDADLAIINELAHEIWWPAYEQVIPHGQISLMLEEFYTEEALRRQVASGGHFLVARLGDSPLGFAEYRAKKTDSAVMRIEKLYVSPRSQGKGVGRSMIEYVAERALEASKTHLELNVNRGNEAAIGFYRKNGFQAIAETDMPYHSYILNDYVMQKALLPNP